MEAWLAEYLSHEGADILYFYIVRPSLHNENSEVVGPCIVSLIHNGFGSILPGGNVRQRLELKVLLPLEEGRAISLPSAR